MSEWISVDDELPVIGVEVLIYATYNVDTDRYISVYEIGKLNDDGWIECTNEESIVPNYWQPLPKPPS